MYDPKSLTTDANDDNTFGYNCEVHSYVKKNFLAASWQYVTLQNTRYLISFSSFDRTENSFKQKSAWVNDMFKLLVLPDKQIRNDKCIVSDY